MTAPDPEKHKYRPGMKRVKKASYMDNWSEADRASYYAERKAINPNYFTPEERKNIPLAIRALVAVPTLGLRKGPKCGVLKTASRKKDYQGQGQPGLCMNPAGWRTDHPGVGACIKHYGTMPSHMTKAIREDAMAKAVIYGAPKNISPDEAILQELARTAGHVDWLSDVITSMEDKDQLFRYTQIGIFPDPYLKLYQQEREHLMKVSKVAKDMGIEERRVRLAEDQGKLIAMVLMGFLRDPDLALTPAQMIAGKLAMRKHLLTVATTNNEGNTRNPGNPLALNQVIEVEDVEVFPPATLPRKPSQNRSKPLIKMPTEKEES